MSDIFVNIITKILKILVIGKQKIRNHYDNLITISIVIIIVTDCGKL